MKKILCVFLSVLMTASLAVCSVCADEENAGEVRIEFCVGDDTLLINGGSVQVEKPYVAGEGVTLVPLRVITEAFGATVTWEDLTRTIDLSYPGVSIHLQIDNPVAEVNGRVQNLLSAPELTNSYTMVPLRFICETFGAEVSYDEATEKITVVKGNVEDGSMLEGEISNSRIGDSFYGWSMENPTDMTLNYREFDGKFMSFSVDGYNYISISISELDENYDFERSFIENKSAFRNYTLSRADKDVSDSSVKTMFFEARGSGEFRAVKIIVTDKYEFEINGGADVYDNDRKLELVRLMSTFVPEFTGDDIHDYSDVKDGMRTFDAENISLSLDIPSDYYEGGWGSNETSYTFFKDNDEDYYSQIVIDVFSKSDAGSAEEAAKCDYEGNKLHMNEDVTRFTSDVKSTTYNEINAYEYSYTVDCENVKYDAKDMFFELGEYVYNVYVAQQLPGGDAEALSKTVMESIDAEEINPDEMGVIMRNNPESTGYYTSVHEGISIELPNNYTETDYGFEKDYENLKTGTLVTFVADKENTTFSSLKNYIKESEKEGNEMFDLTLVSSVKEVVLNGEKYLKSIYVINVDGEKTYIENYATVKNNVGCIFTAVYTEIMYSQNERNEVEKIVTSIKQV